MRRATETRYLTLENVWEKILTKCSELKEVSSGVLGCRFLYSPKATFLSSNGLLIAGMNPGKERDMSDRPYPARDHNAYLWETWAGSADYQSRVRDFVQRLAIEAGEPDWKAFFDRTLTSNFLPFRSESDSTLGMARRSAKAFSHGLWSELLPHLGVRMVVAFGSPAGAGFARVISNMPESQRPSLLRLQHSRCGYATDEEITRAKQMFEEATVRDGSFD